jgi:hypothetical protein
MGLLYLYVHGIQVHEKVIPSATQQKGQYAIIMDSFMSLYISEFLNDNFQLRALVQNLGFHG